VVVGGRSAADTLLRDAWVRDDRMPTAFISSAPQVRANTAVVLLLLLLQYVY
jgi:hypothetical protein